MVIIIVIVFRLNTEKRGERLHIFAESGGNFFRFGFPFYFLLDHLNCVLFGDDFISDMAGIRFGKLGPHQKNNGGIVEPDE